MPTRIPMPIPETIREVLGDLLDRHVAVAKSEPAKDDDEPVAWHTLADFTMDDGSVAACVLADLEVSAALGAALTMVPPGIVNESVTAGRLEADTLSENYAEVLNVMTRACSTATTRRTCGGVRCRSSPRRRRPTTPRAWSTSRRPAVTLDVDIEGYGSGRLAVIVV
ncbi:MAG: hypothetical protein U0W40_04630 [Acidimicrobiia bacterium]